MLKNVNLEYFSRSLLFSRKSPLLHSMLSSCGYQKETSLSYDWDGIKRGSSEFVLWQYTRAGRGHLRFEKDSYDVLPGQAMLLYFPHDNRYRLAPDSDHWEFLYICMHGREVLRLFREIVKQNGPLLNLKDDADSVRNGLSIIEDSLAERITNPFESSARAYSLAMSLLKESGGSHDEAVEDRPAFIDAVIRFCDTHYQENIGVAEMAEVSGYSRYHFSRLFQDYMKEAPALYLKNIRLKKALRVLQTKNLAIKDLASECGFSDCSYFCRIFRETYGMSPEMLRKSGMY